MGEMTKKRSLNTFLLCFFSFFLTIACYQSWIFHMKELSSTWSLELLSSTTSYLFQALGVIIYMLFAYYVPDLTGSKLFITSVYAVLSLSLIPSMFSSTLTGTYFNGFIMNILVGAIWGMNLYGITFSTKTNLRFFVLGGGYVLAALSVFFTTLVKDNFLTNTPFAFVLYVIVAMICSVFGILSTGNVNPSIAVIKELTDLRRTELKEMKKAKMKRIYMPASSAAGVAFPIFTVFLLSMILHFGNNFLAPGEGFLQILGISKGAVPPLVLANIFFFFFGLLTIGRGLWFAKLSDWTGRVTIYAFGFLFGRLGDAAGTGIWMLFRNKLLYIRLILAGSVFLIILFLIVYFMIKKGKNAPKIKESLDKEEVK